MAKYFAANYSYLFCGEIFHQTILAKTEYDNNNRGSTKIIISIVIATTANSPIIYHFWH